MQTYANALVKFSYGNHDIHDHGPYETLLKQLMREKASFLYPAKQALVKLQLTLISTAKTIRQHTGDPEAAEALIQQVRALQAQSKKIIDQVNSMESEFNAYSDQSLAHARENMPKAVQQLIADTEQAIGQTLSPDIKGLFFNEDGMPLNGAQLTALLKERGISHG